MSSARNHAAPKLPFHLNFLCGGFAGAAELCVMYPLDVVKTRQHLLTSSKGGRANSIPYILHGLYKEAGVSRLYRGMLAPLLMEPLKRAYKFGANGALTSLISGPRAPTRSEAVLAGVLTGSSEATLLSPFELTKTKMQAKNRVGYYKNTPDAARRIFAEEGVLGFFRGVEAAAVRSGIWNGAYFGITFMIKSSLRPANTKTEQHLLNLAAGTVSGSIATVFNNPMDVATSRIRNIVPGEPVLYRWCLPTLIKIAKDEGFKALYRGFAAKCTRLGPGGGIMLFVYEFMAGLLRPTDSDELTIPSTKLSTVKS